MAVLNDASTFQNQFVNLLYFGNIFHFSEGAMDSMGFFMYTFIYLIIQIFIIFLNFRIKFTVFFTKRRGPCSFTC